MRDLINYAVFGWYPYLCLIVFLLGSWVRFDREQYTWRSGSSQLLRRRQLAWGSNLFHVGILVIFFGHFVGLLTPIWVFDFLGISHTFKQPPAVRLADPQDLVVRRYRDPLAAVCAAHSRARNDRGVAEPSRWS
jgi:respiratory nitrate reductase gamma subunit